MAAGADAFVRKPFRWGELQAVLEHALGITFEDREATPDDDVPVARPAAAVDAATRAAAHGVLAQLEALLRVDDTAALDVFEEHEATLVGVMGEEAHELGRRLGAFRLADALSAVRAYLTAQGAAD